MTSVGAADQSLVNPTKIIVTLGPAPARDHVLADVFRAGADLARLNFSHGDHDSHRLVYDRVRSLEQELGRPIGVIADLQGPKIRTGTLEGGGPVTICAGQPLTITTQDTLGSASCVSTTYQSLPGDVEPGDRILMDDGLLELQVLGTAAREVQCRVIMGGELGEHKGINLPGVKISAPSLTPKDRDDLQFAIGLGVDYVAISFVRSAADVVETKDAIAALGSNVPVIPKLEKPEAIEELVAIVQVSDAIMVARGDLGVELPPERVPILQKRVIRECARQRVPVITATQMLDSMRHHPRPTRAEASDVANAILDGTDAVMLSGETAVGEYPVEAVAMMRRIAQAAEEELLSGAHLRIGVDGDEDLSFSDALSRAAAKVAEETDTRAIVAFTQSGSTARLASKCRPRVPILAPTPVLATARRCTLYWGVEPVLIDPVDDTDDMLKDVSSHVRDAGMARPGDVVVVMAGTLGQHGTTDMIKLQEIH